MTSRPFIVVPELSGMKRGVRVIVVSLLLMAALLEHVRRRPLFVLQAPQRAYLVALHRVDTRRAVLRPADV